MGRISEVLANVIQSTGGRVFTSTPVKSVVTESGRATGVALQNGRYIKAKKAVICNANIWALPRLLESEKSKLTEEQHTFFFDESMKKKTTKSFMVSKKKRLTLTINLNPIEPLSLPPK
jgi:phytoene dehydrogenase-like protein